MCTARGGGQAFLCPEGTSFNQRTLVCDHKFRVTCSESSNFFHRNLIMHEESMRATEKARIRNKGQSLKEYEVLLNYMHIVFFQYAKFIEYLLIFQKHPRFKQREQRTA